jgi:hypothetical protein
MPLPFNHSADFLKSFFSQGGRGFYIPYYQRHYSWDEVNAKKLIDDLFNSTRKVFVDHQSTVFLGTVILHKENSIQTGVHVDTPNLMTAISNVVDGQQRITSIALLATVLSEELEKYSAISDQFDDFTSLKNDLDDAKIVLQEFYSVEIRKTGVAPEMKPIIIRAGDVSANPATDQWTMSGPSRDFYKSPSSHYLSEFINGKKIDDISVSDRLEGVIGTFKSVIKSELSSDESSLISDLLRVNSTNGSTLKNFLSFPISNAAFLSFSEDKKSCYLQSAMLLAVYKFFSEGCHIVFIECDNEGLAFDMFQALNATGTPLTAFEVFKPAIVNKWAGNYSSTIKLQVDRIEQVFDQESTANRKETITDQVICDAAIVYDGTSLTKYFSEERDWLISRLGGQTGPPSSELIELLADQAEYNNIFVKPRRPNKNTTNFNFSSHLQVLGLGAIEADLAALCIYYLKDAGHKMSNTLISTFYAKLLRAQSTAAQQQAANDLLDVCKATAAFFTFWMGADTGRFPDADYRQMFSQLAQGNISFLSGQGNQSVANIKNSLRAALENQNVYDANSSQQSKILWVGKAKNTAWYKRQKVCKFALFSAFENAVPDTSTGNEGLFLDGQPGSSTFMKCQHWYSSEYEVLEHIATRDQPSQIKYSNHFDATIYPGNQSIVDKLGNLTLLSNSVNASIYSEWPDKVFYYWSLTQPSLTVSGPVAAALKSSLGIAGIPPSLDSLQASSNYLPHLAPLSLRGIGGLKWDSGFIERRSVHLCERVFDSLDAWLR